MRDVKNGLVIDSPRSNQSNLTLLIRFLVKLAHTEKTEGLEMTFVNRLARFMALPLIRLAAPLSAQESTTAKWEQSYMQCPSGCSKDFYFSENTAKEFAGIREACIGGCGFTTPDTLPGYQRCYSQCKKTFPYRHGLPESFAGFQRACVEGCRNIKP